MVDRCRRLMDISERGEFDDSSRKQLFALDQQVMEILFGVENQCSKQRPARKLWSPALKRARTEIGYWRCRIKTNGLLDDCTRDLGRQLQILDTIQQTLDIHVIVLPSAGRPFYPYV